MAINTIDIKALRGSVRGRNRDGRPAVGRPSEGMVELGSPTTPAWEPL